MAYILAADDEPINAHVLTRLLKIGGHRSVVANSGQAVLSLATQERPDLILMDLGMPGLDGWQATAQLKADPTLAHIPVVALTGHTLDEYRARALAAGCAGYLVKPFEYAELMALIAQLVPSE